jgi:hypothetical protein
MRVESKTSTNNALRRGAASDLYGEEQMVSELAAPLLAGPQLVTWRRIRPTHMHTIRCLSAPVSTFRTRAHIRAHWSTDTPSEFSLQPAAFRKWSIPLLAARFPTPHEKCRHNQPNHALKAPKTVLHTSVQLSGGNAGQMTLDLPTRFSSSSRGTLKGIWLSQTRTSSQQPSPAKNRRLE